MAGEGFMMHAIKSLQANRALLKKRNFREIRKLYLNRTQNIDLDFKKVSPEELKRIKKEIREQHKKDGRAQIGIFIISVLLTGAFLYFLYLFFMG